MTARRSLALLVLLPLLAPTTLADGHALEVTASATWPAVTPGGTQRVDCDATNAADEPILVHARGTVTYADGAEQAVLDLGRPVLLYPGETVRYHLTFLVPLDAATGLATFECAARAVAVKGGVVARSGFASFLVVG